MNQSNNEKPEPPKRRRKKIKPRCAFGNDTCDGINGTSGFICRDCAGEDSPLGMCTHFCVACGAPCQRTQVHEGQHECINCGTRWYSDAEDDDHEESSAAMRAAIAIKREYRPLSDSAEKLAKLIEKEYAPAPSSSPLETPSQPMCPKCGHVEHSAGHCGYSVGVMDTGCECPAESSPSETLDKVDSLKQALHNQFETQTGRIFAQLNGVCFHSRMHGDCVGCLLGHAERLEIALNEQATPSPEPPRQTTDIAPKCDCYAMFGQPHFHDCPAAIAKKEASMHEAIKHVPPQYLKERLSFDYSEKRNLYEITGGGYVLAETEDSEIADAICKIFNELRDGK